MTCGDSHQTILTVPLETTSDKRRVHRWQGTNLHSDNLLLCILGLLGVKCKLGAWLQVSVGVVELLLMLIYQLIRAKSGENGCIHTIRIYSLLSACEALTEWEYLPPVGPRPPKGFVGLKNAGATCYMNSVIQQLYMIPSIRNGILAIEGTGSDVDDDMSGDEKQDNEVNFI